MTIRRHQLALIVVALLLGPAAQVLAAPDPETRTVTLERLWSRGGEEDEEVLFGQPTQIVRHDDGRVLVLDDQLCQVQQFADDGEYLGSQGREGEGPGEFRRPIALITLPSGATAVGCAPGGYFERLDPAGTPLGRLELDQGSTDGGFLGLLGARCRGGSLVTAMTRSAFDQATRTMSREQFLQVSSPDGSGAQRLKTAHIELDFTGNHPLVEAEILRCFLVVHAVGPEGLVHVPHHRDEYLIDVYDRDGALVRQYGRSTVTAPTRTDRERARLLALRDSWMRGDDLDIDFDMSSSEMAVMGILVDDRGHAFVRHAASHRDLPPGVFLELDEYAPDGRWLGPVRLQGAGDPWLDDLFWLGDGRVALVRGGMLLRLARFRGSAIYWDESEDEVPPELVVCRWGEAR